MSKKETTTLSALKLALEALERMKGYGNVFLHHRHTQNPYEQVCEAITALREALNAPLAEQKSGIKQVIELYDSPKKPAQQEPIKQGWDVDTLLDKPIPLKDFYDPAPATELREQEPAFYRHEDGHLMTPDRAKFLGFDLNDLQALYTSPPTLSLAQRTWVGLTDEERLQHNEEWPSDIGNFEFDAIEAKLKEKNT